MIPKIVHYCWFGRNALPEMAEKCIASWRRYLPDYEIKEWNEDNFNVNIIPYTAEAYKAKKYAFVSDYARFWILYKYGGLYFDTDVEIIKPMNDIIERGPFMGCETEGNRGIEKLAVAPGLGLGIYPGHELYKTFLDYYSQLSFIESNGSLNQHTIVEYTTEILVQNGLVDSSDVQIVSGINIYPKDFFCPKDYISGKLNITENTVAIHHYGASWKPWEQQIELKVWQALRLRPHRVMWHFDRLLSKLFGIDR